MGMTIAEKIIAAHANRKEVKAGELVDASVDFAMGEDATTPLALEAFRSFGLKKVFDPARITFVADHSVPYPNVNVAQQAKFIREFSKEFGIHFWEPHEVGVEHVLLPEQGLVLPGDIVVGADSHTTTYGALGAFSVGIGSTDLAGVMATGRIWLKVPDTLKIVYSGTRKSWVGGKDLILYTIGSIGTDGANYKSIEFCGNVIDELSIDDRFSMSNMAAEAGAKAALIAPDAITEEYVKTRAQRDYKFYKSDADAVFETVLEFDVSDMECQVACPFSPANAVSVRELPKIAIDQVYIGSCTNGRISDFRVAADILKGKTVASSVRLIVIPSTPALYRELMAEGLIDIFMDAGAVIGPPTCGPCYGGHMGVLAKGEKAVSTSNRNFRGRMGHVESEVYLANPAVAAASAITGMVSHPEEVV